MIGYDQISSLSHYFEDWVSSLVLETSICLTVIEVTVKLKLVIYLSCRKIFTIFVFIKTYLNKTLYFVNPKPAT